MRRKGVGLRAKFIRGLLLTNREMSLRQIADITKYDMDDLLIAVGWLLQDIRVILYKDERGDLSLKYNNPISNIYY